MTSEQLGAVLEAVERDWPARYAEIYLLPYTGMRPGELYALQWGDVDEQRATHARMRKKQEPDSIAKVLAPAPVSTR